MILIPVIILHTGTNDRDDVSRIENIITRNSHVAVMCAIFVYRDFSSDSTSGFDDMLIWISPHILRAKMLEAGILP